MLEIWRRSFLLSVNLKRLLQTRPGQGTKPEFGVYPVLEALGFETWAIHVLGWGFSDLERRPPCNVAAKRRHLYQLWKSHIQRPMALVGPSLGASVAIDFAAHYPEAVSLLKSMPLRCYSKLLVARMLEYTDVGRLHCLLPWWEDATVNFMLSGGYNVTSQTRKVKHKTLLISSEHDKIVNSKLTERLKRELPNAVCLEISDCGHMPHIEKPYLITKLIAEFASPTKKHISSPAS